MAGCDPAPRPQSSLTNLSSIRASTSAFTHLIESHINCEYSNLTPSVRVVYRVLFCRTSGAQQIDTCTTPLGHKPDLVVTNRTARSQTSRVAHFRASIATAHYSKRAGTPLSREVHARGRRVGGCGPWTRPPELRLQDRVCRVWCLRMSCFLGLVCVLHTIGGGAARIFHTIDGGAATCVPIQSIAELVGP